MSGPTWPAGDAAGAARNPARFSCASRAVAWCHLSRLPAARLRPSVGPPKKDMLHFTVARTRIRRQSCTRTHENARPNHQKETEASIVLHLNRKYPVRTIRCLPSRQWFTSKHEISCPNNEKYTEASTVYI